MSMSATTSTTTTGLGPYRVAAYNTAKASENKIHDDAVARRFGFSGGLVPGVDVYAYMSHLPVERWGRQWLERGQCDCRFLKPVYDGETAIVTAVEASDGLDIEVTSRGERCATGHASLPDAAPVLPALDGFGQATPPAERPPADEASLAPDTWLAIHPFRVTAEIAAQYLADLRETAALYAADGLVHPGQILRCCNWALSHNVVLGPWMHVGSKLQHFALAHLDAELTLRARVTANYAHKGHRFVDLDALVLADGIPVAQVTHISIYRPRQVAAA